MPLSHLTLTVSHLPTSTSFFLSCLQPLGYRFIGRHDNHVGFGSIPGEPADFWISEERPGVPAGAAHIAFPAPSREAVSQFFIAALKAGGKIHGEPALRDAEQGYYSAAVVDLDGNSIEAVHRPSAAERTGSTERALTVIKNGSVVSKASSMKSSSVALRPKSEAGTVVSKAKTAVSRAPPSIVSQAQQPAPIQLQQPPTTTIIKDNTNGAKAVVGTLLGAAAGAAIAYAMLKGDSQSETTTAPPQYTESPGVSAVPAQEALMYRAIEAAPMAHSAVLGNSNGGNEYAAYARSMLSKNPRASTIMEGLENCSRVWGSSEVRSVRSSSHDDFELVGRRASSASIYSGMQDNMDMPIRAIEAAPVADCDECASVYGYQNNPSTFISSFRERSRYNNKSVEPSSSGMSMYSSSTMKPSSKTPSRPGSSHHSHSSRSVLTIKDFHSHSKSSTPTASFYSSTHSARNIPLPSGSVTTISTSTSASRRHHQHSHAGSTTSSAKHSSRHSAYKVPLPASVSGASTIFLNGGVDVDSHVTPTPSHTHTLRDIDSLSRASSRKSHKSSSRSSTANSKRSSKFDEPVRPSDSVSQVSTNVSKKSSRNSRRG
ncbi:hypothetical protein AJ80_07534 [Polytolypa hystricis UAMH7299]|uniref:VOC domain-containing protein n=1 Tax=Polytolypa hystricis (strain UAMH7299) TaxID=1447883 RepID=A0A2B7XNJ4_POLH7|nr:hypothetical protein AJ80_07534 [Polytolypa hystricis UAMH7299]